MPATYRMRMSVVAPVYVVVVVLIAAGTSFVFWLVGRPVPTGLVILGGGPLGWALLQRAQRLTVQPGGLTFNRFGGFSATVRWAEMRSLRRGRNRLGRHVEVLTVDSPRLRLVNADRVVLTHYAKDWRETSFGKQLRANRPDLFD